MLRVLLLNVSIGLALLAAIAIFDTVKLPKAYALLSVAVLSVLIIIFGEKIVSLRPARWLLGAGAPERTGWLRIVETLVARESVVPLFAISGCLIFDYVSPVALQRVIVGKLEIVFLILTFAVIAYGIKQSGYFRYAAFRVLEVCDGNMTRMILHLFLLSSVLTYATSNDIVILLMTPIILELCRQSHIRNARLLLWGQFVAANTLSMGILIGSPTNIIVALAVEINFVDYFLLMAGPTLIAIAVSFLVLHFINEVLYKWMAKFANLDWEHDNHYMMPALVEQPVFTGAMRRWIGFFIVVVVAVAVVSQLGQSFFGVTVPTVLAALAAVSVTANGIEGRARREPMPARERQGAFTDCVSSLPYSIVPFALVFFAISDELAAEIPFAAIFDWLIQLPAVGNAAISMLGTAVLVNTVNDLPASAIIRESLMYWGEGESLRHTIFLQAMLVALNIACYITPIGSLSAIIWFHIMRHESAETNVKTPTRTGMIIYGTFHFALTAIVLSILIPTMNVIFYWMIGRSEKVSDAVSGTELTIMIVVGVPILIGAALLLINILKKHRIFLGDVRAF